MVSNNNAKRTISSIERRGNYNDDLKVETMLASRNKGKELKHNSYLLAHNEDQTNMFADSKIYGDTNSIPVTMTAR